MILCSSVKQIEPPYVFNWEHGILWNPMPGNQASACREGEVSWVFSSCGRNLGYIFELWRGWPLETRVCSATSGLLSSYDGKLRNLTRLARKIEMLLELRRETKPPFLVGRVILGFLSIFKKIQASSPFEALNSTSL